MISKIKDVKVIYVLQRYDLNPPLDTSLKINREIERVLTV